MSVTRSHRVGSDGFALLVRLFAGLKRKGRVIDVIWFQHDLNYARAVLALADDTEDDAVREISASLREKMRDILAPPAPAAPVVERPGNRSGSNLVPVKAIAEDVDPPTPENRYIGRLRSVQGINDVSKRNRSCKYRIPSSRIGQRA